jgi:hypothetical protein
MSSKTSLSAHRISYEEDDLRSACAPDPAFIGNGMRQDKQDDNNKVKDIERANEEAVLPSARILNISAFLTSIGNLPIFTRKLFSDAAAQLLLAQNGKEVELADCYGGKHTVGTQELLFSGYVNSLIFHYHRGTD